MTPDEARLVNVRRAAATPAIQCARSRRALDFWTSVLEDYANGVETENDEALDYITGSLLDNAHRTWITAGSED